MRIMAEHAIPCRHLLSMPFVAAEAGRYPDVSAVTRDTITVVRTGVPRSHGFLNILVATGANWSASLEACNIGLQRLMRVMTSETVGAGKMRIIRGDMTVGAFRNRIFCRRVRLMAFHAAELAVSPPS